MEKYEDLAKHLQEVIPSNNCGKQSIIDLVYNSEISSLNELIESIECLSGIASCQTNFESLTELFKKDIASETYGEMISLIYEYANFEKY